jgi:ribosomal 50S subunit-associated protein YjgA (DUF615 family)
LGLQFRQLGRPGGNCDEPAIFCNRDIGDLLLTTRLLKLNPDALPLVVTLSNGLSILSRIEMTVILSSTTARRRRLQIIKKMV